VEQHDMDEQTVLPEAHTSGSAQRQGITRWLWFAAGMVLVGIGGVGIVLPVLPTTVFFIGAAACFARSSPRFEQWVLNLPRIGSMVRDYRQGLGMPRRAKIIAMATIIIAITLSSLFIPSWVGRGAAYAFALVGVWFIGTRVPTREQVVAQRKLGNLYDR
jgi:uncharacterized membrane protein YbaN (DUF454 family)